MAPPGGGGEEIKVRVESGSFPTRRGVALPLSTEPVSRRRWIGTPVLTCAVGRWWMQWAGTILGPTRWASHSLPPSPQLSLQPFTFSFFFP